MILVDVHAHLDFPEFKDDLPEILEDAKKKGVVAIVNNGTDPQTNRSTKKLSGMFSIIKPAYGYYPVIVAKDGLEKVDEEILWIREQKPFAIGEVGLDYYIGDDNPHGDLHKDVQKEALRKFVSLAKELDVPIIIHSRKAEADVLDLLEEESAEKVVLHCFMGKRKLILRAAELGYYFSLPVIITRLEQFQWLAKNVPLKRLLTETDAPYLGPVKGERNDSRNISLSIKKLAEILGMTEEEVSNQIFMNYQRLFL